jgi:tyrosinase
MAATYPITGILQGLGPACNQVPVRQEIDAWYTNPDNLQQVNLFLLALAKFQGMPVTDMKSYYQVAGHVPGCSSSSAETR